MTYLDNLTAWARGWRRFGELKFKGEWNAQQPRWILTYLFNHGTRTLTGGACVTWSRWFYLTRQQYRASAFMTRVLNHAQDHHGELSGDALWNTKDTAGAASGALILLAVVLLLIWLLA